MARLIDERSQSPREDLVSDLVEAKHAGRLDGDELHALVVNIIGGAVGSGRAAISNSALLFLQFRDQTRLVQHDPTLVRPAIEECLRFHPPFRAGRRKVVTSTKQFGLELMPGETVYLARQAANRDPAGAGVSRIVSTSGAKSDATTRSATDRTSASGRPWRGWICTKRSARSSPVPTTSNSSTSIRSASRTCPTRRSSVSQSQSPLPAETSQNNGDLWTPAPSS